MRKWKLIIEAEPNGDWTTLVMLGKEVVGCASASDLTLMMDMGKELIEGCMETAELSSWELDYLKKIAMAQYSDAQGGHRKR